MKARTWPRRVAIAAILLVGISLGALREFLFINLNYQIDHLARHTRFSYAHSQFIRWTSGMELSELLRLKWLLGAAFTAVIMGLCILLARSVFRHWGYSRGIVLGFAGFIVLALLLHFAAQWAAPLETISVHVSHMLQYPVALLFVLMAGWLPRTTTETEDRPVDGH
ncbi:MAG: hypothetical protein LKM36_06745 [Flavobacteriales bacterium]|jgi:hypothetical protein|nr:hypothetical protein [Flavobacteriales bacterium]MBP9161014.1 hypothetical protein [Flavobacteriales bacterium]MCI1752564.1 hypothetical protein [Flavobacteriales bacterium]